MSSYPFLTTLQHDLGPKGLHHVFDVNLEREFHGVQMAPAQEIEANRRYYQEEHGFSCPIAVQPRDADGPPPAAAADSSNAHNYLVFGYPQFTIIDGKGVVRAIIAGWVSGHARDKVIRPAIEQLLAAESTS